MNKKHRKRPKILFVTGSRRMASKIDRDETEKLFFAQMEDFFSEGESHLIRSGDDEGIDELALIYSRFRHVEHDVCYPGGTDCRLNRFGRISYGDINKKENIHKTSMVFMESYEEVDKMLLQECDVMIAVITHPDSPSTLKNIESAKKDGKSYIIIDMCNRILEKKLPIEESN